MTDTLVVTVFDHFSLFVFWFISVEWLICCAQSPTFTKKGEKKNNQTPTHTEPPTEKLTETHTHRKQANTNTQEFKHFCEITHEACEVKHIITV